MNDKKPLIWMLLLALAVGFSVLAAPQAASAQNDPPKQEREDDDDDDDEKLTDADRNAVKVSLESARAIALNRVQGKIVDEELEKERGRLQYAFDIRTADGKLFDVEVSAVTGEVLQAIEETDEDDEDSDAAKKKSSKKEKVVTKTTKLKKPKD